MIDIIDTYMLSAKINNRPTEPINGTTGGLLIDYVDQDNGVLKERSLYLKKETLKKLYIELSKHFEGV